MDTFRRGYGLKKRRTIRRRLRRQTIKGEKRELGGIPKVNGEKRKLVGIPKGNGVGYVPGKGGAIEGKDDEEKGRGERGLK
jgi:hypothetical protein